MTATPVPSPAPIWSLLDVDAGADKEAVIGGSPRRSPTPAGPPTETGCATRRWPARHSRPPACPAASRSRTVARPTSIPHHRLRPARPAVDFGAPDGPADLVFLIAAPDAGGSEHMKLLSSLARALVRPEFVAVAAGCRHRPTTWSALVDGVVNPAPAEPAAARGGTAPPSRSRARGGQVDRGHHRVPDRYRAYLHGRRRPETGRRTRRRQLRRRDPGQLGQHAAGRRPPSPAPTRSSSPPMSVSRTGDGSPASRSSPPVSNARSTNPTR